MHELRSILVGVDFEDGGQLLTAGSRIAAQQALWLGEPTGATVDFLHSTYHDAEAGYKLEGASMGVERMLGILRTQVKK